MELRQLEHFVAIAEEGSFTRAAHRVHIVQSGLSVSVQALEKELNTQLFERTTHHVALTDAGRAMLPHALQTLESAAAARLRWSMQARGSVEPYGLGSCSPSPS